MLANVRRFHAGHSMRLLASTRDASHHNVALTQPGQLQVDGLGGVLERLCPTTDVFAHRCSIEHSF